MHKLSHGIWPERELREGKEKGSRGTNGESHVLFAAINFIEM